MSLTSCGCGGCGCSVCQPANVIFQGVCPDPGAVSFGAALSVLDANFCERRLANPAQGGLVVVNLTPQGYQVSVSNSPIVSFQTFAVTSGSAIGTLLVEDATGAIKALSLPNTAGLYLSTNASGQLILGPLPTFTVPDPLTVTTANITNLTAANFTLTGSMIATGLGTGTLAFTLGIDAGGNVIKGAIASTGIQTAMFFESATSPAGTTPNSGATAGTFLIIGNQLYDSGASLIGITNATTLKCLVAGSYTITWDGQVGYTGGTFGTPAIQLVINGVIVNTGNGRPLITSTTDRTAFMMGFEMRDLNVNDTIQLQLAAGSGGVGTHVYEARIGFTAKL